MNAQRQTARAADAAPVVLACTLSPGAADYALAAPRDCRFFDGHFPEEAEQNEIGGPVVVALMILAFSVLLIWALG